MNVIKKIDETVKKFNMLSNGDTVVVGVSGGKDSMLLLNYLIEKSDELNLKIIVANVEHGIRGESSKRDTQFVKDFCRDNGVEFRCLEIDAPSGAKAEKTGVEEYSRKRRYEFFNSLGGDKIATAHSLSDNVETVLFRLSRGTSLKGAKGIPAVRGRIIRPLIECSADEIINACNELEIPYVTDETNFDDDYSRNLIRNQVIPLLKKINPQTENAINRFIACANEDDGCLSQLAEKYVEEKLNKNEIAKLSPAISKRVIEIYSQSFGVTLDEKHLREVNALLFKNGKVQIKDSLYAVSNKDYLYLTTLNEKNADFTVNSNVISIDEFNESKSEFVKKFAFYCDCDKISGEVFVRKRLSGDEITLEKRNCTKSLKKLFNELEIPIEKRYSIPVICDCDGVIGVYKHALSKRVAVDGKTSKVFLMNIKTEDKN